MEQWESRIAPRLREEDWQGFRVSRGRVAKTVAHYQILGGRNKDALHTVKKYGSSFPSDRYGRLLVLGAAAPWTWRRRVAGCCGCGKGSKRCRCGSRPSGGGGSRNDQREVELGSSRLNITWVVRSLLDYRVPVIRELDALSGGGVRLLYSQMYTPPRVQAKLRGVLGERAVAMSGEKRIGPRVLQGFSNSRIRVVYQPRIFSHIRQSRPDVMIGEGFFQWTSFALGWRILRGVPLVVSYERTFHTERNAQWFRRGYRRMVMHFVDAMCCNGRLCVEYSRSLGMDGRRITTPNMVADTETLARQVRAVTEDQKRRMRQSWNAQGTVVLYVGRLVALKGLNYLLEAWSRLERQGNRQATLVIVGGGSEETALREQAARLGLRNVRLAGAVDYDNVASCYAAADALVIPTLDDNWSLVVPEAMACGLPVLCSKYNGCWPELVHQGRNGWVFDPLDPEDLAGCLSKCIDAAGRSEADRRSRRRSLRISRPFTRPRRSIGPARWRWPGGTAPAARIAGTPRVELPARRDGVEVQSRPARPRITWIVRSLLDYRVPVIQEVDEPLGWGSTPALRRAVHSAACAGQASLGAGRAGRAADRREMPGAQSDHRDRQRLFPDRLPAGRVQTHRADAAGRADRRRLLPVDELRAGTAHPQTRAGGGLL